MCLTCFDAFAPQTLCLARAPQVRLVLEYCDRWAAAAGCSGAQRGWGMLLLLAFATQMS